MMNAICLTCRTTSNVGNEILRNRQLLNLIKQKTAKATEEQKMEAHKKLSLNPHLRQLCHSPVKCKYNIPCAKLNKNALHSVNEKICEELVLLSCVDKVALRQLAPRFRGDYPKAVAFINRQVV